jgi:hypothetical protein
MMQFSPSYHKEGYLGYGQISSQVVGLATQPLEKDTLVSMWRKVGGGEKEKEEESR